METLAKVPLSQSGQFDSTFMLSEEHLPFILNQEVIMRLVYLPENITTYENTVIDVNYTTFNCVYNIQTLQEVFTIFVEGKQSKLHYITSDFTKAVDRWAPIQERKYAVTSDPFEMLHEDEPFTLLDLHRTITDSYTFDFQLTDEFDQPIEDQPVWLQIGIVPKSGNNFKVLDWKNEEGEYVDTDSPGTMVMKQDGDYVLQGPGIQTGLKSPMYSRPETYDFIDIETGESRQYSAYYWD